MFGTGGLGAASLAVKCAEDAPAATAAFQDWRIGEAHGCFLKWWYPQGIHFKRVFHHKRSILGYHYFRKPPYLESKILRYHQGILAKKTLQSSMKNRIMSTFSCLTRMIRTPHIPIVHPMLAKDAPRCRW